MSCTYGAVQDGTSGSWIGGVTIQFYDWDTTPVLEYGGPAAYTLDTSSKTWSSSDPGSNGAHGAYYLNPYAPLNPGDNKKTQVNAGWKRIRLTRSGHDTLILYRPHYYEAVDVYRDTPYSAGPYPHSTASSTVAGFGRGQLFKFWPNNINYVKTPDLIVDPRTLRDNVVMTGTSNCQEGYSKCLRYSVATANVGNGDLWLVAPESNNSQVSQRRFYRNGGYLVTSLPGAQFEYHAGHDHMHVKNWTITRLRKVTSACNSESTATNCPVALTGQKTSFQLQDGGTFDSAYTPNQTYSGSPVIGGLITQGMGAGKIDTYNKWIGGQSIDIAGLPPGTYWLEVEVNPDSVVIESDYTNNVSRVQVTL